MKWRDLTPEQLRAVAMDLFDDAHDAEIDREWLIGERGYDVVAVMEAVAARLQREAAHREKKTEGR